MIIKFLLREHCILGARQHLDSPKKKRYYSSKIKTSYLNSIGLCPIVVRLLAFWTGPSFSHHFINHLFSTSYHTIKLIHLLLAITLTARTSHICQLQDVCWEWKGVLLAIV